jgi:hypothetical protein
VNTCKFIVWIVRLSGSAAVMCGSSAAVCAAVCGSAHGSVCAVRLVVYGSERGSLRLSAVHQRAAVRQCAAVRQGVAVRAVVWCERSARSSVRQVVCALGSVWQCGSAYAAVLCGSVRGCVRNILNLYPTY